jgi:excisionase family DNA binding protein
MMLTLNKLLYSRLEVAEMLSISQVTLWRLVRAGKLVPQYIGTRQLFSREELQRFTGVTA